MTERAKKLLLLYYKQSRKIRRVSGLPPLTFKAKKAGTLENYRIYGNTVDGESVGDRTGNLFDENGEVTDQYVTNSGDIVTADNGNRFIVNKVAVKYNTTYTFSWQKMILGTNDDPPFIRVSSYDANNNFLVRDLIQANMYPNKSYSIKMNLNNAAYWDIRADDVSSQRGQHLEGLMLNEGSTPLPYEPYGYKVPVTVTNGTDMQTTNLYLPEQIKMVGSEAEYVDYNEQKQHRVRKNLLNIETDIIPLGFQYGTVTIFNDLNVKGFFKECEPNTTYTISRKTSSNNNRFSIGFSLIKPENGLTQSLLDYTTPLDTLATSLTLTSPAGARYVCCYLSNINEDITPDMEIMLEKNDYATDYEPYIEDTELDVTLPALPTLSGTNTLTVGTEVQPSGVEIKGRIKAAGGD